MNCPLKLCKRVGFVRHTIIQELEPSVKAPWYTAVTSTHDKPTGDGVCHGFLTIQL